jgi:exoribonuclease R
MLGGDRIEYYFDVDEKEYPIAYNESERYESDDLIGELMVLTNHLVAKHLLTINKNYTLLAS